eukprot:6213390-Pleurochrysis_carterae.AAC.2
MVESLAQFGRNQGKPLQRRRSVLSATHGNMSYKSRIFHLSSCAAFDCESDPESLCVVENSHTCRMRAEASLAGHSEASTPARHASVAAHAASAASDAAQRVRDVESQGVEMGEK